MVLYRCVCSPFNINNNNYRALFRAIAICYAKLLLFEKKRESICFVIFELGGGLDEALIVENIIKIAIKKNVELLITLFVIESLENNQKANNSFYSYFFEKYSISSIYFFSHIINFKNQVNLFDFKNIIFLNLDPFDQLREQYYKNEVEDIKNLFNQLNFFLDLSLYSLNNFFYDVELSYVFFYKNYQKSLIYQKKLLGKNNKINFLKINLIKI